MAGGFNRRDALRTGGWAAALGLTAEQAGAAPAKAGSDSSVYTRIGARPFINCTATYTINGGALSRPEVKRAMEEASYWPVNLDELMEKVGAYIAPKLGAEAAIVTNGAAAALTLATCGCVAGRDPEKMQQIPNMDGLKNEVIVPRQSRNAYDHAVRTVGVKMVEVDSPANLDRAFGPRTAMIMMLGTGEPGGPIKLENLVAAAAPRNVPILVDAAAELALNPNPYLKRGASLVAYSGGKILRAPQPSGLLLGKKTLVAAAWANASPHHAYGRALKVGKEEIMGMVAAIDVWTNNYNLQADYDKWRGWLKEIGETLAPIGVKYKMTEPAGASPFPTVNLEWDPKRYGITAGEVGRELLAGTPRVMSHAEGGGFQFRIRPVAMKEGEAKLVAGRLTAIFKSAEKGVLEPSFAAPAQDIAGGWRVEIEFEPGSTTHTVDFHVAGNKLSGKHRGRVGSGELKGSISGAHVGFSSSWRYEGQTLHYDFKGRLEGGAMSGEVELGEYGTAKWKAVKG